MSNQANERYVPGAPAPARLDALRAEVDAAKGTGHDLQYGPTYKDNDMIKNNFPVVPFPKDEYDTAYNIKQQFVSEMPNNRANWVVPFSSSDAEFMARKRDAAEQAQYDEWIAHRFDLTDPAQLRMYQQIAPGQFERRRELIEHKLALQRRMAIVRLLGPQNEDDLKLEWLVETGRLVLEKNAVWDPSADAFAAAQTARAGGGNAAAIKAAGVDTVLDKKKASLEAGYFSPLKFLVSGNRGKEPNANRTDIYAVGNADLHNFGPTIEHLVRGTNMEFTV